MAEGNGRARSALMRNLPKKGWTISGDEGTFQDLKLSFGPNQWTMTKDGAEVKSGEYGRTQMTDVAGAAREAGSPFAGGGGGGGGGKKKAGGAPASGGDKRAQMAAARAARKAGKVGGGAEPDPQD